MQLSNTIVIADDIPVNRAILCELFKDSYRTLEAANGQEALERIRDDPEAVAVLLLDIVMPVMDGYGVLEQMRREGLMSRIPVVLITAESAGGHESRGLDMGAADILLKPFDPHIVRRRVDNIIELYRHKNHLEDMVEEQTRRLRETNEFIIDALSTVIEYRSLETGQHIRRIRFFTRTLLEEVARSCPEYRLSQREIDTVSSASAMHDIGKIAIPDSVLLKPGRLSAGEFEIMKTHTTKGCEILRALEPMEDEEYLGYCYNICRHHHERWDGRGYPDGLREDGIPLCAQVVSVADCYDALTHDRVYKPAIPHADAVQIILDGEGGSISHRMAACFRRVEERFRQLSLAYEDNQLSNGRQLEAAGRSVAAGLYGRDVPDGMRYGNLKYFAALQLLGATVAELDCERGHYRIVYRPDSAFDEADVSGDYDLQLPHFLETYVHPEDRAQCGRFCVAHLVQLFRSGRARIDLCYRKRDLLRGGWGRHRATILRLDAGDPNRYCALLASAVTGDPVLPQEEAGCAASAGPARA